MQLKLTLNIIGVLWLAWASQLAAQEIENAAAEYWPQWRGPIGTGEAPGAKPPISWSETENIQWKTELTGRGHSTPIVWRDHVFITAAVPIGEKFEPKYSGAPGAHDNLPVSQKHRFLVIALDRASGKILWQKQVHESVPHEGAHYTGSLASASPVTDGKHVIAMFGSYGIYCLDFKGNTLWQKSLGTMHTKHGHGEGSSPAYYQGRVIVNWDHEGDSFIAALDIENGKQLWRVPRQEVTSWASPIVIQHQGRAHVIVAGTSRVRGYDLDNGKLIWECGGLSANVVATPVAKDGFVYAGSSYDSRAMFAIRLEGAQEDITGTDQIAWFRRQRTPYVPSPMLYDGSLFFLRHYQGILTRVVAKTGEEPTGPFRLERLRDIYASPVAANGRLYVTDRNGMTAVVRNADVLRVESLNKLDDRVNASLAIAGTQIFVREKGVSIVSPAHNQRGGLSG